MKYPFTTVQVNKNKIVNFLFDCGVDKKPGDKGSKKKRIRDRIDYARDKKRIEVKRGNDGDYLIVAEFFKWAVEIWPELERIENLPLQRNTVVIHGIVQAQEANVALNVLNCIQN